MLSTSEREWAKANKLRKTNLWTHAGGNLKRSERRVYESADGKLYYINRNQYCGTFRENCWKVEK